MFLAEKRLTKKEDFNRAYQKGKVFSGDSMSIKIARNEIYKIRFGFSVGKKIFKNAVLRNKIKRRLREAFRPYLREIKSGFDIVVFCNKREWDDQGNSLLKAREEARQLLKKAKLLKINK